MQLNKNKVNRGVPSSGVLAQKAKDSTLSGSGTGSELLVVEETPCGRPHTGLRLALREDNLGETQLAITEVDHTSGKPEVAREVKPLVEHLDDLVAVGSMRFTPVVQRASIVLPQVFPVHRPQPVARQAVFDLGDRRQIATREDVLVHPGVCRPFLLLCDGVQYRDTTLHQQLGDLTEVLVAVTASDMLEHADADDAIELLSLQVLVIHQLERHQVAYALAFGELPSALELLFTERNTQHPCAVQLGRGDRQVTPAAPDIQQVHPGLQLQLAQQVADLLLLRLRQAVVRVLEVRARIQPCHRVKEQVVIAVPHVVVGLDIRLLHLLVVTTPTERLLQRSGRPVVEDQLEQRQKLVFADQQLLVRVALADRQAGVYQQPTHECRIGDLHRNQRGTCVEPIAVVTDRSIPELHPKTPAPYELFEHIMCYHAFKHVVSSHPIRTAFIIPAGCVFEELM